MAVIDVYANSDYSASPPLRTSQAKSSDGATVMKSYITFAKGAETAGSIYRLCPGWDPNNILLSARLACAATAGWTAVDLGLYVAGIGGAAIVDNCYGSALSLAAGFANLEPGTAKNLFTGYVIGSLFKRAFEYAGYDITKRAGRMDLCLTTDTDSANNTCAAVDVLLEFIQG